MAGITSIGQHHHHLERLNRRCRQSVRVVLLTLALAACSASTQTALPSDLAAYVPSGAKITSHADRKSASGRTANVVIVLTGAIDDYVATFKSAARAAGYEEQVDQLGASNRVIAYSAAGDKTLTLTITKDATEQSAAIVLANP